MDDIDTLQCRLTALKSQYSFHKKRQDDLYAAIVNTENEIKKLQVENEKE